MNDHRGHNLCDSSSDKARYVPPHLRDSGNNNSDDPEYSGGNRNYNRDNFRGENPNYRGGYRNDNRGRYGGRNSDRGEYNNYGPRRDNYQNGIRYQRQCLVAYLLLMKCVFVFRHWSIVVCVGGNFQGGGFRQGGGGGYRNDQPRNDRWQEPEEGRPEGARPEGARPDGQFANNQRNIPKGDSVDYTVQLARNERVEAELFGTGNTGINFNKYEDIPGKCWVGKTIFFHLYLFCCRSYRLFRLPSEKNILMEIGGFIFRK